MYLKQLQHVTQESVLLLDRKCVHLIGFNLVYHSMIEIRTYVKKHQEITKLRNVPSAKFEKSRQFWERLVSTEERMQVQNETEQIYEE